MSSPISFTPTTFYDTDSPGHPQVSDPYINSSYFNSREQLFQSLVNAVNAVPETARDSVGTALVQGSGINIAVNDAADTITISATGSSAYSDENAQDAIAALIAAGTHSGITFTYNDTANTLSATVTAQAWSQITGKPTFATVATTGSYNDLADKPTIPTAYSDEAAQDAAASLFSTGTHTGITFTYDDAGNRVNAAVTSSGSSSPTPTAVKTSSYSASLGDFVLVDTASTVREVRDAALTTTGTITSNTAAFISADVGKTVAGVYVPIGATIATVISGTQATLSSNPSANVSNITVTFGTPGLTITLPTGAPIGSIVPIRKITSDGWPLNVLPPAGETIDGATTSIASNPRTTTNFRKITVTDWAREFTPTIHRSGVIVNAIGDSIAPGGTVGASAFMTGTGSSADYLWWAHLLSNASILEGAPAGIGSTRIEQMYPRLENDVLSLGGSWCIIHTSTNDAGAGTTPATWAANIRSMVAAITARGQRPILTTPCPHNSATVRLLMDKYRRFLISYAAANNFPLVDFWSLLADPLTGTYKSIYLADGIHPNVAGKQAMGQLLISTMTPLLPPFSSAPPRINALTDSANLLANALFINDANSDGVPDSWTKTGTGTVSLITGDSGIVGNALRISDSASSGTTQVNQYLGTSYAGKRLAFTGLIKVPAMSAGSIATVYTLVTGTPAQQMRGIYNWDTTLPNWQRFYVECTAPADNTALSVVVNTNGGTGVDVQVAQLGVYDLTAQGL